MDSLTNLFNLIWQSTNVPADWWCGVIVTLPNNGNLGDRNHWQGITLLSIPGKVLCCALLQCQKSAVDNILRSVGLETDLQFT